MVLQRLIDQVEALSMVQWTIDGVNVQGFNCYEWRINFELVLMSAGFFSKELLTFLLEVSQNVPFGNFCPL